VIASTTINTTGVLPATLHEFSQHGNRPCCSCGEIYTSVAANLSSIHAPVDGTPGSRQIRTDALDEVVSGLQKLLELCSTGCRPGGNIGMVALSLLHEVYAQHLQSTDVQRTQRNLRRAAYDLRTIFNNVFDPAQTLISLEHRRRWGYDLALKPGSLIERHLHKYGYTFYTLYATQSLSDLVFTCRNLEFYHRDSYKLSVHDLPLLRTLRQKSEVQIGLDKHPACLTYTIPNEPHEELRLQILGALGWTDGFTEEQLLTLSVLLPEWEGTTRDLLNSARLL
jgi:hypothetical protein